MPQEEKAQGGGVGVGVQYSVGQDDQSSIQASLCIAYKNISNKGMIQTVPDGILPISFLISVDPRQDQSKSFC